MTQATNPIWITEPETYIQKLITLLGARDPLTVMAETADVLSRTVSNHPVKQMRARPFEGKWTPNEVIGHLVDAEWVYGFRTRHILGESDPPVTGMDQDLWVAAQQYNEWESQQLIDAFSNLREINLIFWRNVPESQLDRCGRHNERGPESLRTMRTMLAGHDLWHIDQSTRYLNEVVRLADAQH